MRRPSGLTVVLGVSSICSLGLSLSGNISANMAPKGLQQLAVPALSFFTIATFLSALWTRRLEGRPRPQDVDSAVIQLAIDVGATYHEESIRRQLRNPLVMPVRWHAAEAHPGHKPRNARRVRSDASARLLPGGGHIDDIAKTYRDVPAKRLVILGAAGAGKTVYALQLALDLLEQPRERNDPVPVIMSLASWNPGISLNAWLTENLLRVHTWLAAPAPDGRSMAATLVGGRRVLPILDGFDEIHPDLQPKALRAFSRTGARTPLIVTSRSEAYGTAAAEANALTAAAVIELDRLSLADLEDYLPATASGRVVAGTAVNPWCPVLEQLRENRTDDDHVGSSAVLDALTRPLNAYLARTTYSDRIDRDPSDMLTVDRFQKTEDVENYLLGAYLSAMYPDEPTDAHRYNGHQARRWLTFLARSAADGDIALWQLGGTIGQVGRGVVAGVTFGAATGLWYGLVYSLLTGAGRGLISGIVASVLVGVLAAVSIGKTSQPAPRRTRPRLQLGRSPDRAAAKQRHLFIFMQIGRMLHGMFLGLLVGAALWVPLAAYEPLFRSLAALGVTALAAGILGGPVYVVLSGILFLDEVPVEGVGAAQPADVIATDRDVALLQLTAFGLLSGVGLGTWFLMIIGGYGSITFGAAFLNGFVHGVFGGLAFGVARFVARSAWGRWIVFARFWLPLRGALPWRIHRFLRDAHERGVLRQAGVVYQFRHASLRDHLLRDPGPRWSVESHIVSHHM